MHDRELRIKMVSFVKESPSATLLLCFMAGIVITRTLTTFGFGFNYFFAFLLLSGSFLIFRVLNLNRTAVLLSPDSIQFFESIPVQSFILATKKVNAKWEDVTKVQTYETLMQKWEYRQPKSPAFGGAVWGSEIQLNDLFILKTKLYVRIADSLKEKSFTISMTNEKYPEYLIYLKNKLDPSKMDSKTIELQNPKILMDEMMKRKVFI